MKQIMKIPDMKIGHRLSVGFGMVIALMFALTIVGATQINDANRSIDRIQKELYPKTVAANALKDELNQSARSMRGVLLTISSLEVRDELANIERAKAATEKAFAGLEQTPNAAEGKLLIADAKLARARFAAAQEVFIKMVQKGQLDVARDVQLPQIAPLQRSYQTALEKLAEYHNRQMESAGKDAEQVSSRAVMLMVVLLLAAGVLAILVGTWVTRSITRPLNKAVEVARRVADGDLGTVVEVSSGDETGQLLKALRDMNDSLARTVDQVRHGTETIAQASRQIATGNADLSARTESQASSLEETASSMEQLTSTVTQNAESAQQANNLVVSATDFAIKGGKVVGEVVETMGSIKESSSKIVDIIGVIDGIAFQTNILALNAAVEAARAGEQGRGFAVVAAEVRSLAQRSANAAKEIKTLIDDSVDKVDLGSKLVNQAGKTMDEIVNSVLHVADIMKEITAASHEQSAGIAQVNQAIVQMDEMTQQNATLVQEASAAADSLQDQALALTQAVAVFKLKGAGEPPPAPVASKPPARAMRAGAPDPRPAMSKPKSPPLPLPLPKPEPPMRPKKAATPGTDEWEEF
jgi:methyl-accepting chemotaxis protein